MADHERGTYTDALSRLAFAQKGSRNAPAYSRWVNRPLGRRFAALAYVGGLTPDRVTGISACFTFAGIGLLAAADPTPVMGVLIAALLVVGYALDSADGQLARLRGGGTPRGEWLDHVTDAVKNSSVHLAVLISWYRSGEAELFGWTSSSLLLIPLAYAIVWSTQFYAKSLTDQLRLQVGGPPAPTSPAGITEPAPWLGSVLTLPNDYGLLCLVLGTIGIAAVFTPLYLVMLAGSTAFLALSLRRWSGELRVHVADDG